MSTLLFPVAEDLAPGDEVTGVGEVVFASPRTVASRRVRDEKVTLVFTDGSDIVVPSDSDVSLLPPF